MYRVEQPRARLNRPHEAVVHMCCMSLQTGRPEASHAEQQLPAASSGVCVIHRLGEGEPGICSPCTCGASASAIACPRLGAGVSAKCCKHLGYTRQHWYVHTLHHSREFWQLHRESKSHRVQSRNRYSIVFCTARAPGASCSRRPFHRDADGSAAFGHTCAPFITIRLAVLQKQAYR